MLIYSVISSFIMILIMLWLLIFMVNSTTYVYYKWFTFMIGWDLEFVFNKWILLFFFVVLFISLMVMFFVISYFSVMPVKNFLLLYMLFVVSMSWLILVSNFYWMMLGWDGLGVVSFLLICYYQNYESNTNALFTLFQNRIGDLFFIMFLMLVIFTTHSSSNYLFWGSLALILGASVKSAQFPFNSWLLAAMSAPTPISSLVHSSTLVVAGVYVLLQYSYCLMEFSSSIFFLSMSTLAYSMFGLLFEVDMKKLIAYSTMSHVGLMMLFYSQSLFKLTYFHLITHAMFKSMMFMCFGFCMLVSFHAQDYRLVTYSSFFPLMKFYYYYACLCMMGLPFLSAFFSKDFFLEKMMEYSSQSLMMVMSLIFFLAVSVFYSMRLLTLFFFVYVVNFQSTNKLSSLSLFGSVVVSLMIMNILISLVFSLSLEFILMKLYIYYLMVSFFILFYIWLFFKKWFSFEKFMWMKEVFYLNFYFPDLYSYHVIHSFMSYLLISTKVKFILLFNWWVILLVVFFF